MQMEIMVYLDFSTDFSLKFSRAEWTKQYQIWEKSR